MNRWRTDTAILVLRVASGLIFIPHGVSKVFGSGGVATFAQGLPSYGIPTALGYIAAYSELIGGILLILGLLTRIDAALLGATMFVAAFIVQLPDAVR
ncbi:MAG TPA: DoxX family protein, partial [Thermoanaerobaculia bacterium]